MPTIGHNDRPTSRLRRIRPIGTTARIVVGILLLGSVTQGHLAGPFRLAAWALGLLGFPALLLGWQWLRARCTPTRLQATGPIANLANVAVFLALYLTPDYAPALSATSDAALLFSTSGCPAGHRGRPVAQTGAGVLPDSRISLVIAKARRHRLRLRGRRRGWAPVRRGPDPGAST